MGAFNSFFTVCEFEIISTGALSAIKVGKTPSAIETEDVLREKSAVNCDSTVAAPPRSQLRGAVFKSIPFFCDGSTHRVCTSHIY